MYPFKFKMELLAWLKFVINTKRRFERRWNINHFGMGLILISQPSDVKLLRNIFNMSKHPFWWYFFLEYGHVENGKGLNGIVNFMGWMDVCSLK